MDMDLDLEEIPPPLGSSSATGGILRGQAYGNVLNHADFPNLNDASFKSTAQVDYTPPLDPAIVLKKVAERLDSVSSM